MRLLVAAAVLVVASVSAAVSLNGRGGESAHSASTGSCPLNIRFGDTHYVGTAVKRTLRLGRRLGRAFVDPCPDLIARPSEPVAPGGASVMAIVGIPPSVAVGAAGQRHFAYLAFGYFPELPSHPLHEGRVRDLTRGCRATERFSLVGRVRVHGSALMVEVDRSSGSLDVRPRVTVIQLLVDKHTRIEGFDRNGLPYVTAGDRLRSRGVTCQFRGAGSPAVVARTITEHAH
jgi:hypothetical protein